jgi:hypothetical protein
LKDKIDKVIGVGGADGLSKRPTPNIEVRVCTKIDKVIESVRLEN